MTNERKQLVANFMKDNRHALILLFFILYFTLVFVDRNFLLHESVYYNSLSERFSDERISTILAQRESLSGWAYPVLFLTIIAKISGIVMLILMGLEIANIKIEIRFLLLTVVVSQYVFLIEDGIRTVYLMFISPISQLQQYADFNRRNSIVVFFNDYSAAGFLVKPLSHINFFHVLSTVVMAFAISCFTQSGFRKIFTPVFIAYASGLFLWITLLAFLSIGF